MIGWIDAALRILAASRDREALEAHPGPAGLRCHEALHRRAEPCPGCPGLEALRTGLPRRSTVELDGPGGKRRLEIRAIPLGDADGRTPSFIEVAEDVTDRDRIQEERRASEERYRTLVEASLDGVYLIQDGRFRYVNGAIAEAFGYGDPEEIIAGRTVDELVAPEDRDLVRENIRRRLEGEVRAVHYTFTGLRKDGSRFRCEVHGSTVPFQGRPAVLGTMRDVSERERAEAALRESEERYRRLFESAQDGIFIVDGRGVYRDANPAGCRLFGYRREEIVGRDISLLIFPEDLEERRRSARVTWRDGAYLPRVRMRHRDGSEVWVEVTVQPYEVAGERLVLGIKRDITARVRAERERERLAAAVERAQKLEALGRLAGGIAHDFNNLLTGILGAASLLLAKVPEEAGAREDIRAIIAAAERAGDLTRQLLAFSRRQVLARKAFDLNAVVSDLEPLLRRIVPQGVAVRLRLAPSPCPIEADPGQIAQVVMNLVVNARDAIEGEGAIAIETAEIPGDGPAASRVRLTVSDTGKGMTAEEQERMFEPFFTTKARGRGTGLGLASVYGIVRQHGGQIEVESRPGRGSTIRILLPRTDEPLVALDRAEAPREIPRGRETILLIEDDASARDAAERGLRDLGYRVLAARDAEEARQIARDHAEPIDLVVTDVVLPDGRGPDVAEKIRSARPAARVLFISGYPDGPPGEPLGAPDGAFLPKPFTLRKLARKVREVLDGDP